MVDPQNTTTMIDTGQKDGRNGISSQNNGNHDQKRLNLVENTMSNQKEERNNTQDGSACVLLEGEDVENENGDTNDENRNQRVRNEVKTEG